MASNIDIKADPMTGDIHFSGTISFADLAKGQPTAIERQILGRTIFNAADFLESASVAMRVILRAVQTSKSMNELRLFTAFLKSSVDCAPGVAEDN